ncbi:hypothetical protein [Niveibacterium sp. SC-1]|uniref:hypothetical protein n=1 Tax=Niveibacterium sp. SC-1 TaxID=3135646 RepID=UPI00311DECDB
MQPRHLLCASLLALAACATPQPVLYPNTTYQQRGEAQAKRDVAQCIQMAENAGAVTDFETKAAGDAAKGAVVGGAAAGVGAAIWDTANAGKAAGAGAAAGAVFGGLNTALGSRHDSLKQSFVNRCLHEKGYDVIGWK